MGYVEMKMAFNSHNKMINAYPILWGNRKGRGHMGEARKRSDNVQVGSK
jgi:hypothetical protein